jgi:malate synthase
MACANLRVGVQYLEAGSTATAASALQFDGGRGRRNPRSQIWQWLKHSAALSDGRRVTHQHDELLPQELARIEKEVGGALKRPLPQATKLFSEMSNSASFTEFLTLPAYELLD